MTTNATPRLAPGPRGTFLLGNLLDLRRDLIGFLRQVSGEYGDIVRFTVAGFTVHLVTHPDHLRHVLQVNSRNYDKQSHEYRPLKLAFGEGLFTSDGDFWKKQRRLMQPAFHRQRILALGEHIVRDVVERVDAWQPYAQRGESLDVAAEMVALSMNVATKSLFSTGLRGDEEVTTIARNLDTVIGYCLYRTMVPFAPPPRVPTRRNREFTAAMTSLDGIIYRIIGERREHGGDTYDLLSMLLEARDEETGEGMPDKQMRDEIATLLLGGYETTSNQLSWAWYELSRNPDVEARLHEELDRVLGDRLPTVADVPRLEYTNRILEETLRLYPVPWLERRAAATDSIGGYHVKAGSLIYISPYLTHRHPDFWAEPERFDPDRFTPERSADRPRFAYFPFGGGPRLCIGNRLAQLEAQLTLATIAQRYRLRLVPDHPVEAKMQVTTSPRYGLRMTLEPRRPAA
ncbi:cytochrome P450 [Micromonospora sp. WMMD882]|uniref:cytochrome P450 n=1 Tax=Micromonospora sp. WMMD882 TaxID=3015151 RepID=UPI00248B544E|nr:cytochrome P450 [Micromonospora sp. WMMD882]WBB80652.1 cytochrome P450 [Micromonospora sp. WMMD882]